MSQINKVPIAVQQLVDNLNDKKSPDHIRFNYMITVEAIRDYCDSALKKYNSTSNIR